MTGFVSWVKSNAEIIGTLVGIVALIGSVIEVWRRHVRNRGETPRQRRRRLQGREQRYARWFGNAYRSYENPYLNKRDEISLNATYVALAFQAGIDDGTHRPIATDTIATGNAFVIGDPGSGKSTLLKAFGVRLVEPTTPAELPILVSLRRFAKRRDQRTSLAEYILTDVLGSGAGLGADSAKELLAELLVARRCVVLLDGLDEVPASHYDAVRDEVFAFTTNNRPELPTAGARVIITCRRHNFLRWRDDWSAGLGRTVYALAPFRDADIVEYVSRQRDLFVAPEGPARYVAELRASGVLDLHRTPLVLAMSVGLFAPQRHFTIPSSVPELYQQMIVEMLERHHHRHDPHQPGGANRFGWHDKHQLLREFALTAATGTVGFDEFARDDLRRTAVAVQPKLRAVKVDHVDDLVDEIIEHSGLLADASDGDREAFVFAHRSIQEYFVANELAHRGDDGERLLLDRADDDRWERVTTFYTAMLKQPQASRFLRQLANNSATVAGSCLAGADCTDDVALSILDGLASTLQDPTQRLPALGALIAATGSPRLSVAEAAATHIGHALPRLLDEAIGSALDVDGVIKVLGVLARSPTGDIATMVPRLAATVPDDSRLVRPLWRCIVSPDIDAHPQALTAILTRLLDLAMDHDGLTEIQGQEPLLREAITDGVSRRAYPFDRGLDRTSPLVSLLALAQLHDVTPTEPNRFFEAKATGRLASLELPRTTTIPPPASAAAVGFVVFWLCVIVASVVPAKPGSVWAYGLVFGTVGVSTAVVVLALRYFKPKTIDLQRYWGLIRRFRRLVPRLGEAVELYEDERSRHWILPDLPRQRDASTNEEVDRTLTDAAHRSA